MIRSKTKLKKWEYKVVMFVPEKKDIELEHELNEIGQDGWELISFAMKPAKKRETRKEYVLTICVFKRSIE